MAGGSSKRTLSVLSVLCVLAELSLAGVALWFFTETLAVTSLRNTNHYLLDYRVHWVQAVPWLFVGVAVLALPVALCGWMGALRGGRGLLATYMAFALLVVVLHVVFAALVFAFVDERSTDTFIKDTVYDGFYNSGSDERVLAAFGAVERRLRCCGANDARDYRSMRDNLPPSCCGPHALISCDFTEREPNERLGCAKVAAVHALRTSMGLAAGSILVACLEVAGLVAAWCLLARSKRRRPAPIEMESKNGLLRTDM